MAYVIGVDDGGTTIKAGLFGEDGVQLSLYRVPSATRAMPGGRVEIDLDELWAANASCVSGLVAQAGVDPAEIACIGFAGQGKGLYLLGAEGRTIRRAITSADDRARSYSDRWAADGTADLVGDRTYQGVFSAHPASMLAWLRDHEPETFAQIRWVLSMKDYLVFRATDQVVTDVSVQSGNGFVNLGTKAYDPEILRLLGLPEISDKLPPMSYPAQVVGQVTGQAAAELGLAPGTDVIAGMFDIDASALAAGVVDDTALCMITGTAGVNVYLSDAPIPHRAIAMNSLYCIPDRYLVEEGSNSSVGYIDWVVQVLFPELWERGSGSRAGIYREVEAIVAQVDATASDVVFLPYLAGDENSGDSRGVWYGMTSTDRREHLLRGAYEGIVFAHRRHVERLLATRSTPAVLRIAGGGASSLVFPQLAADVFQSPIEVCGHEELGVRGIGMAAAIAAGIYRDFADAATGISSTKRVVRPNPALADVYERKYRRFLDAATRASGPGPAADEPEVSPHTRRNA